MKLPDGYGPREPCADGAHVLCEHNHDHVPGEYWPRCSRRFLCARCRNWLDCPACTRVPAALN